MNKKIKVMTRLENEDNLKVARLVDTYTKSGTIMEVRSFADNDTIIIEFTIKKSLIKKFERDLNLINYLGIKGKITA